MNATALTNATSAPPAVPAESTATPGTADSQAPGDFILALAQQIAGVEAGAPVVTETLLPSDRELQDTTSTDASALAQLPVQFALPPIAQAAPTHAENSNDPLELLGLGPKSEQPSSSDLALFKALSERLANAGVDSDAASADVTQPSSLPAFALDASPNRVTQQDGSAAGRTLHTPVGTPAWTDELGSKLTMMTEKGQHTASLRLSPEHLGPLEIRIAMRDDQASVWFGAAHADTRAAIEHALPRLREMFASQGMSLADAGVFHEPPRQPFQAQQTTSSSSQPETASTHAEVARAVRVGLLDAYA